MPKGNSSIFFMPPWMAASFSLSSVSMGTGWGLSLTKICSGP